ncbi:hypothetical protein BACDOR_04085 [Phocaeicola dorei DSM 17855]|uniref:Uncharacterized protein n=1 Tax=Phocaeicola dorei DSM 17855 TaxID=483217 RepID=B6W2T9_9BACT|nr:hypothetical protein BACDOR_04085 [Phocaeicola dorei DSM 17855]
MGTFANGKYTVKEVVQAFASGKVVRGDGTVQGAFGSMCQDEEGQPVFLLEIVELDHQPSCRIPLFHGTAQIGKVINDEYPASCLQCHLLDATDDCLLEVGIKEGITIKGYTVQPFGEGIQIAVLVGIAELELFLGQLEI